MISLFIAKLEIWFAQGPAVGTDCTISGGDFFFIPPWWKYLGGKIDPSGNCAPAFNFTAPDIGAIGLAILEMLIKLVGFLVVASIILAGIELIASEGNSEKALNARNRLINSLKGLALVVIAVGAVAVVGARLDDGGGTNLPRPDVAPITADNPSNALTTVFNFVFAVVGAMALLFMVIAGFRLIIARGEPNKIAEARKQITYAAIGLILVFSAAAIVNVVLARID